MVDMQKVAALSIFIAFVLLGILVTTAISNNRELYTVLSSKPDPTLGGAYRYSNLIPSSCNATIACIAAQYNELSYKLGFVNPYTAHFASIACKLNPDLAYLDVTNFIFEIETNPNAGLEDSLNKILHVTIADNDTLKKPIAKHHPGESVLGQVSQYAGIAATAMMPFMFF